MELALGFDHRNKNEQGEENQASKLIDSDHVCCFSETSPWTWCSVDGAEVNWQRDMDRARPKCNVDKTQSFVLKHRLLSVFSRRIHIKASSLCSIRKNQHEMTQSI